MNVNLYAKKHTYCMYDVSMYICVYVWIFVCVDTLCMHICKYTWIWTYLPPDHPVFTSHAVVPCFFILSASMAAYFVGWSIIKAAPKHAEKVAWGSFIPSSVPAIWGKNLKIVYMRTKSLNVKTLAKIK